MEDTKLQKHVFLISIFITISIFSIGFFISYGLDILRVNELNNAVNDYRISADSYLAQRDFIKTFKGDSCTIISQRIPDLKEEINNVGNELSKYGEKTLFKKKDFDYLKRKYFLLELNFYLFLKELKYCDHSYIPILFFYKKDDDLNIRQGYVLDEISKDLKDKVIVFSFDIDYEDEPILNFFKKKYNISNPPTIIIDDNIKIERIVYTGELKQIINNLVNPIDIYSKEYNFSREFKATGTEKEEYISNLSKLINLTNSSFAEGDIYLILGRLTNNNSLICKAADFYKKAAVSNVEEKAIIHETIASINCGNNPKEHFLKASEIWEKLGNNFRADLDKKLAFNEQTLFEIEIYPIPDINKTFNSQNINIGSSYFILDSSDILVSQTDRVTRDWLSYQLTESPFSEKLLTVFSEGLYLPENELLTEIGWHEGARIKELKKINLTHKIASGSIAVKINNSWYTPDEKGILRFEVPIDKILYPTTRFLSENIALITDTHGINMLVEQALRYNSTVVIGCCDSIGKIRAAKYLSDKGIKVICPTDKYLPLLLLSNSSVLGSPPITLTGREAIIGNHSINFNQEEKIIVEDISFLSSAQSYYDTPARYFKILDKAANINPIYISLEKNNEAHKLTEAADFFDALIIAARVYSFEDYLAIKRWLASDKNHKIILFHSLAYPYGYKLFKEFSNQTSFDDINPTFS